MNYDIHYCDATVMKSSKNIREYIYGGRAIVTLMAPFGVHHSYYFALPSRSTFPEDVRFVYALHEGKKLYIGMIEKDQFRLTQASRFHKDNDIVKGAYYIMRMAHDQALVDRTPMILYHNGTCAVCGRELSSKKALATGVGRACKKYVDKRLSLIPTSC